MSDNRFTIGSIVELTQDIPGGLAKKGFRGEVMGETHEYVDIKWDRSVQPSNRMRDGNYFKSRFRSVPQEEDLNFVIKRSEFLDFERRIQELEREVLEIREMLENLLSR